MDRLSDQYKKEGREFSFPIIIRDEESRQVYYENSMGDWCRSEYDKNGNHTYNETSDGFWMKREYDSSNKVKSYKDSSGISTTSQEDLVRRVRVVVIDDDPITLMYMRAFLSNRFKDVTIETQQEPLIVPGYDVYMIDNQFDDTSMAIDLVSEIKKTSPKSLIVSMSSTLDYNTLLEMVNRGCTGVYDKTNPRDNEMVLDLMRHYMDMVQSEIDKDEAMKNLSFYQKIKNLFRS